jgi:hypothetical protein
MTNSIKVPRPDLNGRRLRNHAGTIYLIDGGLKREVQDWATFHRLFDYATENYDDTSLIDDGPKITNEHQLIKGSETAAYYLTDFQYNNHQEKMFMVIREITAAGKAQYGFTDNINTIPQVLIDNIQTGHTINGQPWSDSTQESE